MRILLPVVALLFLLGCEKDYRAELKLTEERQIELATAVFTLWVDDCGGMAPEIDVSMPNRLTTPIAYTTTEHMQDPFGKPGERLLYLPTYHFANTGLIAIISRGPDGILQSTDLPTSYTLLHPLVLPDGTIADIGETANATAKDTFRYGTRFVFNVHRYKDSSGVWKDNDRITIHQLPSGNRKSRDREAYLKEVRAWFIEGGAPPYDPTNGATSRGDIILLR
ncbi:hypothetical protein GC173_00955 [bacterium]|nr:hypothetical protein [bacterium]